VFFELTSSDVRCPLTVIVALSIIIVFPASFESTPESYNDHNAHSHSNHDVFFDGIVFRDGSAAQVLQEVLVLAALEAFTIQAVLYAIGDLLLAASFAQNVRIGTSLAVQILIIVDALVHCLHETLITH